MRKDKGASAVEYALLFVLVVVVALVAVSVASSAVENTDEDSNATQSAQVVSVETYEVEGVGLIKRWEDPKHDVICWSKRGRREYGISCVPKSQLTPTGPTVAPSDN